MLKYHLIELIGLENLHTIVVIDRKVPARTIPSNIDGQGVGDLLGPDSSRHMRSRRKYSVLDHTNISTAANYSESAPPA